MRLLATLRAQDVESVHVSDFDYTVYRPRTAVRVIVLDENKVALIHVKRHDYYMLPGGGIENGDMVAELHREVLEELGCEIKLTSEVGAIEVYFDRWSSKQTDFCFTATKIRHIADTAPTGFEIEEGHTVVWAESFGEAVRLVKSANPVNRDGKLVRARDLLFLERVAASRSVST